MYENIQEGQYLIKILSAAINNVQLKEPEQDLQWDRLYRLAVFHNVSNMAYYGLQKLEDMGKVPKEIMECFIKDKKKYSSFEATQHFEVRQVLQRFERCQLFCVPYNGYILKSIYRRPDMRYEPTTMLLVQPEERKTIHIFMEELGYSRVRSTERMVSYYKAPGIIIEMYSTLFEKNTEHYEYFLEVVNKKMIQEKDAYYQYTFSKEDYYIYLMTFLAHNYAKGCSGIGFVLDVWVYLKRYHASMNQNYIQAELKKLNLDMFARYMEELADVWFGDGQIFSESVFHNEMEQHILSCNISGNYNEETTHSEQGDNPESVLFIEKEELEVSNTYSQNKVFPPFDYMAETYPLLRKMPFLLPLFWIIRISENLLKKD